MIEAKDTVMKERGPEYDANCGQEIACDILPKYLSGQSLEDCYLEISRVVIGFVEEERQAQAEISFKAGQESRCDCYLPLPTIISEAFSSSKQAGIKEVVNELKHITRREDGVRIHSIHQIFIYVLEIIDKHSKPN